MENNTLSVRIANTLVNSNISDVDKSLKELPTKEILKCLNPDKLRKLMDIMEYTKSNLIGVNVGDIALYEELITDIEKNANFFGWLKISVEEYHEYHRLSQLGDEQLEHWLGTPGSRSIPTIKMQSDLALSDIARSELLGTLDRAHDIFEKHQSENPGQCDYVAQCTWWGIKTRAERIAYVSWLKTLQETQQAYQKSREELIARLRSEQHSGAIPGFNCQAMERAYDNMIAQYKAKRGQRY